METQVRTSQLGFVQPQRLSVPLFQRPYVWNEANQWQPLWVDVTRVAERQLFDGSDRQPHFLGAVVLQQVPNPSGSLQQRTVIDGEQRLTTLQLLIGALAIELSSVGAERDATRLQQLLHNADAFCDQPDRARQVA